MAENLTEVTEAEIPEASRALYLKGMSAAETSNFDFAIKLLQQVVKDNPGFLEGRQLLRKCAIKNTGGAKKKKGLLGGMTGKKLQSIAKKDPKEGINAAEEELAETPYSPDANDVLFDCANLLGLRETAFFALETVREGSPEKTSLLHKLAEHYLSVNEPEKASEVYNTIVKEDPTDSSALKGAKDSIARASMKKGGWSETADISAMKKDAGETAALEAANRTAMTRGQLEEKRDQLAANYAQDQHNLFNVRELADIYEQLEDWGNAATFYDWAFQISSNDTALQHKASEMKERLAEEEVKNLEKSASENPDDPEVQERLEALKSARVAQQVETAKERVEQNPTDPKLRFELGQAFYAAGDYGDAIPHLQRAKSNPAIMNKVLLLLGKTFKEKKMYDLAVGQLEDALSNLQVMDGVKKEVLYEKGLLHEEMSDKTNALECYKQIYEVDYGYRDVAQRVESSY